MANPSSMSTGQEYYWNSEATQQNMDYYPVPNYLPSNYPPNPPSNYNSSCPYNVPPHVSEVNTTNSIYHPVPPPMYHDGSNTVHNVPYQNQVNQQYDIYQKRADFPQQTMDSGYNMDWNTNTSTYNEEQACNEWSFNNPTANWTTYQSTSTSWYDPNKTCDNNQQYISQQYEPQQPVKEPEWKYDSRKPPANCTNSRNRSKSPSSSGRLEKSHRYTSTQYEKHRDKRRQYDKRKSSSKDYRHESRKFERRSSYKRHDSRASRSETPYTGSKYRKRSRSQESHASRDTAQTGSSAKRKCPTERELLLEKYR